LHYCIVFTCLETKQEVVGAPKNVFILCDATTMRQKIP